jgi:hypothetical protein
MPPPGGTTHHRRSDREEEINEHPLESKGRLKLDHYPRTASLDEAVQPDILLVRVSASHHAFLQES